jgi:ribosomal protein S18 acetylase RimI-like enzyme
MDVVIRPARPEEFAALGEITVQVYRDLLPVGADAYLTQLRDVRSRAEHTELLVAADGTDGALLGGVAFAQRGSPYSNVAGPGEGEFRMLAVAPAAQRRGVAEKLVRACLDRATELGLHSLVLATQPNMLTAQRLYARLGFGRAPERDWEPIPGLTLWVMTAEIGAARPATVQPRQV